MKSLFVIYLYALVAVGGMSVAAENGEPEPPIPVHGTIPLEDYFDALADFERVVDAYFHAALRKRLAASDEKLRQLEAALEEQARQAKTSDLSRILTTRETLVRAKLTMLRELDSRFASGSLPADVTHHLETFQTKRRAVIGQLIEGGVL